MNSNVQELDRLDRIAIVGAGAVGSTIAYAAMIQGLAHEIVLIDAVAGKAGAEAGGFKKFQLSNKKIDPNIAATVDATLALGELTETIEVAASLSSVQSDSATVGKLLESSQIALMQLNGRNPVLLARLKAGVRSNNSLSEFSFGLTNGGFNINGSRSQDNLITYDGAVGIRTRTNGTSIGTADVDAVQEVQILAANYAAEYGRSGGGQIRIVTKSGTQNFHGTFYPNYAPNQPFGLVLGA